MVIYNDESTPTVAQQLYNRMLDQDKVDLVLAPFSTFVGGAVVPIVTSHKKLLFNGGFVGINIFKNAKGSIIGSYTYQEPDYTRGTFRSDQIPAGGQAAQTSGHLHRTEPVSPSGARRVGGKGGALNFAKEAAIAVPVNEQYPPNTTDFTGLVQKAKAANADLVLQLGLPNDTLQVARTIGQQNYKPAMFCTCGSQATTLSAWPKLGSAAEGASARPCRGRANGFAGLAELAEAFKARGYDTLPTYAIVGYAILQVIEQAVEGANTLDQDKLRAYVHSHEFKTVAGDFKYQDDGTPVFSQILLQFVKGKNQVVWPAQHRTAAPVIPMP